jgi:hypothetical protein
METSNVDYILRGEQTYKDLPEAQEGLNKLVNHVGWNPGIQISYVTKPILFKLWVPSWLIKLLTY